MPTPKTRNSKTAPLWLKTLTQLVGKHSVAIVRFEAKQWRQLQESQRGVNEFTIAPPHDAVDAVKIPTPCLIFGKDDFGDDSEQLYFGLITSRSAVTTLHSRIKVRRAMRIRPDSEAQLLHLISDKPHSTNLQRRLQSQEPVLVLSPKLSGYLIEQLASIDANHGAMRAVAESLSAPKHFKGTAALQEDALRTALRAFGLPPGDKATTLELVEGRETALARIPIMEDSVVEHDARRIPGYDLVHSDLTGRAVFRRGNEQLEVYTANRRPLEHVFGVDLVYLNVTRQNIVMLQYKMLERTETGAIADWIYRPDAKLDDEIKRMRKFATSHPPGPYEYRLNPAVFYLKFVKRDGSINNGGIITPIDHFEQFRKDPACRGPKKGLRVSYTSLTGRYLREGAFLDLIRSGYIGAHADTTAHLKVIVDAVLEGNRAVVAAIQETKGSEAIEDEALPVDLGEVFDDFL